MYWDGGGHAMAWTGMAVGMALFWALVVLAVVAALTMGRQGVGQGVAGLEGRRVPDARAVLAARLARGEIDVAEYESRFAALERAGE